MKHLYIIIGILWLSLSCHAQGATSPFEFRCICSPYNTNPKQYDIEGTHSIDNDWSLWGHNLWKVLDKNAPQDVYAIIDGKRQHLPSLGGAGGGNQYCFSSPRLYSMLRNWIIDQWGMKGGRFSIIPMDNKKVCMCERCQKLGNTTTSATPAVAALVTKLAKEFPKHQFFMAAYHTTTEAPHVALPKNAGVLLSTIDIPMRMVFQENKGFKKFETTLQAWKKVASLIYVWEYDRNFDDYLSPYPTLLPLQQRLKYYRSQGIKGIFINDSDTEYASFDDMQTYVIAKLLLNPDADVDTLVRQFYHKFYPESGKLIADYYLSLEQKVKETNHILPFYGTIEEEVESYLDPQQFVNFWKAIDAKKKAITDPERQRLNKLLTALAYSRLKLGETQGISPEDKAEMISILKQHGDIRRYQEQETGTIDSFLEKIEK